MLDACAIVRGREPPVDFDSPRRDAVRPPAGRRREPPGLDLSADHRWGGGGGETPRRRPDETAGPATHESKVLRPADLEHHIERRMRRLSMPNGT